MLITLALITERWIGRATPPTGARRECHAHHQPAVGVGAGGAVERDGALALSSHKQSCFKSKFQA